MRNKTYLNNFSFVFNVVGSVHIIVNNATFYSRAGNFYEFRDSLVIANIYLREPVLNDYFPGNFIFILKSYKFLNHVCNLRSETKSLKLI